jgi:hypothetical protein
MTDPMTNEERIAALEAEIAKLKAAAEPKPPFKAQPFERYDPTANASMSPTMMREMAKAVGSSLVRDVVRDGARPVGLPPAPSAMPTKSVGSAGWSEPRPLEPPPGIKLIDAQVDEQDRRDKVELVKKLGGG